MVKFRFKKFSSMPQIGGKEIVGVDFSGNQLRVVSGRIIANRVDKLRLFNKDIGGLTDDGIAKAIKSIFSENKLRPSIALNIIPSHLVITKNIEMPSRDPKEIKEIVNLQAGRHTPFSREEIVVDYIDLGTYKNNYTKVLLAIVSRSVIKRQFQIFDTAGVNLEKALFAPESAAIFLTSILKQDTQHSPASVIHIDGDFTDFFVIFKGKVIYPRSIPIGADHLVRQKEQFHARFIEEIKNSFEAYESEDIEGMPTSIILTGVIDQLQDIEQAISSVASIPITKLSYLSKFALAQDAQKLSASTSRVSFFNTITALFTYNEAKLSLMPEETKLRRSFERRSREIIKTGILVILFFVLIFSLLISQIYFKSLHFAKLQKQYQSQYEDVKEIEDDFNRIQTVKSYLANRGYSLETLSRLFDILPQNVKLSDINYDSAGKLSIRGIAKSMSSVFSFVEEMEKSGFFKDVTNRYTTKRKEDDQDVADFEIVCNLKKAANK